LCREELCVNPKHLEAVTPRENLLRSHITLTAIAARKTHCANGHLFTPETTMIIPSRRKLAPSGTTRCCYICHRQSDRESWRRRHPKPVQPLAGA
jgi:hypothetical protein